MYTKGRGRTNARLIKGGKILKVEILRDTEQTASNYKRVGKTSAKSFVCLL